MAEKISDEFNIELATQYSGSYTDEFMSGSIFTTGRIRVSQNSGGSNLIPLLSASQNDVTQTAFFAHQKNRICGLNYRFVQAVSSKEIYNDSLIPDPMGIYKINGGKLVFSSLEDLRLCDDYAIGGEDYGTSVKNSTGDAFFNLNSNAKFILSFPDISVTSSVGTQISDNIWNSTFPFQQRYSTVLKFSSLPNIVNLITDNEYMVTSSGVPVEIRYTTSGTTALAWFGGNSAVPGVDGKNGTFNSIGNEVNIEFVSLSQSGDVLTASKFRRTAYEILGKVSGSTFVENTTNAALGLTKFGNQFTDQTSNSFIKTFYGFGNGFRNTPTFDYQSSSHSGSSFYQRCTSPVIRGWKYGLYNGVPTSTKVIFQRGKFGQIRHMLEQRPYTKFFDGTTLSSPVTIVFVSGSNAALTASLSSSLNTRESGQYNFEYRSGLPFFETF